MDIELDPDFIMQDASGASFNGARSAGLNSEMLMCYFHVVYNIRKLWKARLRNEKWTELKCHIRKLHLSRNEEEKNSYWEFFMKRYQNGGKNQQHQ